MPIQHLPLVAMHKETVRTIRDMDALGLWAYLRSLPDGVVFSKADVCGHFGIGREKLGRTIERLKALDLVRAIPAESGTGQDLEVIDERLSEIEARA